MHGQHCLLILSPHLHGLATLLHCEPVFLRLSCIDLVTDVEGLNLHPEQALVGCGSIGWKQKQAISVL